MLIKKNLKTKRFAPYSRILEFKKQPFPLYPICKKQNDYQISNSLLSSLFPKIEQALFESLPCQFSTKRQAQKKKILSFLYPINFFSFQKKKNAPGLFSTYTVTVTKTNSRRENNIYIPLAQPLEKGSQLKIILKSYNSQLKDIKISISTISKLMNYLDNSCVKQFKKCLINWSYFAPLGLYSSFFNQLIKIKNCNPSNGFYPGISNTFSLLGNLKIWTSSFRKKQKAKATQMSLNLNSLIEQPLIELLGKPYEVIKKQKKNQSTFVFSMLQKTNYCNRYFFKSSVFLDNNGPINKQVQKAFNSTQLFTVIRSPFVFKKTREQFIKQQLSCTVTIELHSPIQKQLFIQCLSLLRLPVELEIHC